MSNFPIRFVAAGLAALFCTGFVCGQDGERQRWDMVYVSSIAGMDVRSGFNRDRLDKTPPWRAMAESPPLTARRADALAKETMQKVAKSLPLQKNEELWFDHLRLEDLGNDRWIWIARYRLIHGMSVVGDDLEIVILMDGAVVAPVISKR